MRTLQRVLSCFTLQSGVLDFLWRAEGICPPLLVEKRGVFFFFFQNLCLKIPCFACLELIVYVPDVPGDGVGRSLDGPGNQGKLIPEHRFVESGRVVLP